MSTTDKIEMLANSQRHSTVSQMVNAMLSIHTTVDGKTNPDLLKAIREKDILLIRDLQRSGSESLESTLEAIVYEDNDEVLQSLSHLISEDGEKLSENSSQSIMKYAIDKSSLKCVRVFIDMGIKVSESKSSLIEKSIEKGDTSFLEYILENDPKLIRETRSYDGKSALHLAAECGKVAMVKVLLEGSKVDQVDNNGNTPLHLSAGSGYSGSEECMKILINKGANIEARNNQGLTPLHKAAIDRKRRNANFLISRNAQLNSKDINNISIIQTMSKKVPQSMEEFLKHLDSGIAMEKDDCNSDASINLDFTKLLDRRKFNNDTNDMTLFLDLVGSQFKEYVEHPLCQAFLYLKFYQVKWFFIVFVLASHLIFSVVYSTYAGILFVYLCAQDEKDTRDERWNLTSALECNISNTERNKHIVNVAAAAWAFLIISTFLYFLREVTKFISNKKNYFLRLDAYINIFIIVSVFLICHQGQPQLTNYKLKRWQFHVAVFSCLLLWVEMTFLVGKLPRFGKYVQMFRSVTMKMMEFSVAYGCLAIGFMMAFMILFSSDEPFNKFPGTLVSVFVMMLGEINYQELYYPQKEILNSTTGEIDGKTEFQQFPGTAQLIVILFVLVFSIVIMNLLVGLAVSDISALLKSGKRDQLIAQVELINYVEGACSSKLFKFLPLKFQCLFKNKVLNLGDNFEMYVPVKYSDINDRRFTTGIKRMLYEHCKRKEDEEKQKEQEKELSDIKAQLVELKNMLSLLQVMKDNDRPREDSPTESGSDFILFNHSNNSSLNQTTSA